MHAHKQAAVSQRSVWLAVAAATTALLMLSPMLVGTASADHLSCGDIITEDTTLTHDVGPCENSHGLIIRADNITVDLGGHTVFAATPNGPMENVGIRLGQVEGVTLRNGTVEGFDAGVDIVAGGGNTIEGITARNNVNDMAEPFVFVSGEGSATQPDVASGDVTAEQWAQNMLCFYGDGITTSDSDNNVIRKNTVVGNGPYGGITLVGDSDGNRVEHNTVNDNNIRNWTTRNTVDGPEEGSGLCGATAPGAPGMQRGRQVQAIGVRVEGPGANNNVVDRNSVDNSALAGIAIHSYVCMPADGAPTGPQDPNEHNVISKNKVRRTGMETVEFDSFADGISSMAQGPIGRVTCTSHNNTIVDNNSSDNMRHGVSLHRTVDGTEVSGNVANGNAGNGIYVAETEIGPDQDPVSNMLHDNRAHNNAEDDGFDGNADCDNNDWMGNRFKTVNQACVAAGGTGWVGGPGNSGNAPGNAG